MCAIDCVLVGLDWAEPTMQFILHVTCSCISHAYILSFSIYLLYLKCFGTFLIISLSLPLFLFTLVVSIAPNRKSTPSQNPFRFGKSSSSDPTLSHLQFRDDDAHKTFQENFSRCGIHSKRQVILVDFVDTDLLMSFTVGDGSHCVMSRSSVLSCLSKIFTPTCMRLIVQYLFSSLTFEVCAFLSYRNLLRMCFGFLGQSSLTTLVVSIYRLCPRMSLNPPFVSILQSGVSTSSLTVQPFQKAHGFLTW